jgi:hypothetical protein
MIVKVVEAFETRPGKRGPYENGCSSGGCVGAKTVGTLLGALCLGAGITAVAAYQFGRSNLLRHDSQQTREAVVARIPLGTAISRAETIMEAEAFSCRKLHNTSFAEDRSGGGPQVVHPPADHPVVRLWRTHHSCPDLIKALASGVR